MRYVRSGVGCVLACVLAVTAVVVGPAAAQGATPAAAWNIASAAYPSDFRAQDNVGCETLDSQFFETSCARFVVTATNVGGKPTGEKTVTLTDAIPAGLTVHNIALFMESGPLAIRSQSIAQVEPNPVAEPGVKICSTVPVRCVIPGSFFAKQVEPNRHLLPGGMLTMYVSATVNTPATPGVLVNHASVSGGGIPGEASTSSQGTLEGGAPGFGLSMFDAPLLAADGLADTQAGAHPYGLTTQFGLNSTIRETPEGNVKATTVQDPRDVIANLPVGVAGSGISTPRCTLARLASRQAEQVNQGRSACPADTILGYIRTHPEGNSAAFGPLYNLIPDRGYAAELGYLDGLNSTHVLYVSLVPTPEGYVLSTAAREIPQVVLTEILVGVFGDPAARNRANAGVEGGGPYVYAPKPGDVPTFTNPSDCTGEPLMTTLYMDSWQSQGSYNADGTPNLSDPHWVKSQAVSSPPVTGCEALAGLFNPVLSVSASASAADTPTGLDVNLKLPQSEGVEALGTPPVRNTVVTLPEGLVVNPSSANRVGACSEAQIGWQGKTPAAEGELEDFNASPPACPHASQVGTVELEAPALPSEACKEATKPLQECPQASEREKTPLTGAIYLASQNENPFGSTLALYIVVNDPRTGVVVKIPAEVKGDPVTGRLTTRIDDTPQFPFSELRTHFFGGSTAPLRTPSGCGTYTVGSTITPWSAPQSGPPATPSASFEVTSGVGGGGCPGALPFAPSFAAGMQSPQAAAFSPFSVTVSRGDGEQSLSGASVVTPPGLLGIIKGVERCGEPQAAQGTCGAGSLIGSATTSAGAGPEPFWVHGGRVYLTGPYNGAPFGLSIVVPAVAGPFDLGNVVVRAAIHVDPHTAQITVLSDPLPQILDGISLDVRTVNVTVDRPGFLFNPTSCDPMNVTGTISSTGGASSGVSSRFQAAGCAGLAFKPSFKVSTQAKTSKKGGASLDVKVGYPSDAYPEGHRQANIRSVAVMLPKQLPSRLSTIQQACPDATFTANPASCPAGSNIGIATAVTPILAGSVAGPAYLVSHGGAAFPDLVIVLQGEGVTLDLVGSIDIKKGVTSSAFNAVPDAPISSFELKLPEGPHSGLTAVLPAKAKGNLCGSSLAMPTTLTGQNGTTIKQNTKIQVTGCPKAVKKKKAKAKKHKQAKHKKHKHRQAKR